LTFVSLKLAAKRSWVISGKLEIVVVVTATFQLVYVFLIMETWTSAFRKNTRRYEEWFMNYPTGRNS